MVDKLRPNFVTYKAPLCLHDYETDYYTVVYLLSIETQKSFCNKIFLKLKSLTFGQIKRLGVQ